MPGTTIISKITLPIILLLGVIVFYGTIGTGVEDACWYGLTVDNLDNENINYYHLNTFDAGVVVTNIESKAEKAGVKKGDLVTGINGIPVYDIKSFLSAARTAEKSNGIAVNVKRDGKQMCFVLSGSNAISSGYTQPLNLGLVPPDPFYLTGGTNTPGNTNRSSSPVQSQRIPSEGIWLGMEIEQITPGTIRELNLPANQTGIIVDSVPVGSAAEKAGLKNDDIISSINGQMIVNMADYIKATDNQKITTANLEIVRNGKHLFLTILPEENGVANASKTQPPVAGQFNTGTAPSIKLNAVLTHGFRGVCVKCHQIVDDKISVDLVANSQTGNNYQINSGLLSPAQQNAAHKVLVEGHWLGMELIPITPKLARVYKLPNGAEGLLVDEVTLEAAESGLLAGDVLQSINNYPIKTMEDFAQATRTVESLKEASLGVLRKGKPLIIKLRSSWYKLGVAQNEAAQPIKPGALSPHIDRGRPCTDCHIIMKNGGQLPTDAGDILPTPPPITNYAKASHPYKGKCNVCHVISNK